jgi:hypothetical protein
MDEHDKYADPPQADRALVSALIACKELTRLSASAGHFIGLDSWRALFNGAPHLTSLHVTGHASADLLPTLSIVSAWIRRLALQSVIFS